MKTIPLQFKWNMNALSKGKRRPGRTGGSPKSQDTRLKTESQTVNQHGVGCGGDAKDLRLRDGSWASNAP